MSREFLEQYFLRLESPIVLLLFIVDRLLQTQTYFIILKEKHPTTLRVASKI